MPTNCKITYNIFLEDVPSEIERNLGHISEEMTLAAREIESIRRSLGGTNKNKIENVSNLSNALDKAIDRLTKNSTRLSDLLGILDGYNSVFNAEETTIETEEDREIKEILTDG